MIPVRLLILEHRILVQPSCRHACLHPQLFRSYVSPPHEVGRRRREGEERVAASRGSTSGKEKNFSDGLSNYRDSASASARKHTHAHASRCTRTQAARAATRAGELIRIPWIRRQEREREIKERKAKACKGGRGNAGREEHDGTRRGEQETMQRRR